MTTDKARVYYDGVPAGILRRKADGFAFTYDSDYLHRPDALPVSQTLPLRSEPYESTSLFPFFDGLLPEGWLLDLTTTALKIDADDRFGLLLGTGGDTVGAVTVHPIEAEPRESPRP
jgi:serine/threonine-protein kinase HipA